MVRHGIQAKAGSHQCGAQCKEDAPHESRAQRNDSGARAIYMPKCNARALGKARQPAAINGSTKQRVIHRRGPWRSLEAVEYATLEWVDWFNNRRLLEPIGNVPPAEAEAAYYAALEEPAALAA